MSSDKFKTCIGVPVFNEEAYIADTLLSLKKQDLEARFLISDNASTDRTLEIITDLIQGDSRFELIQQPSNIGSWRNFQYLYENSFSEYFMWFGGHDLLSENFLPPLVAILDEKPDVAIAAAMPWKVMEGQAPESMHDCTYDFSDPVPINRYLKAVAEITNCTVVYSPFRRKQLHTIPQTFGWDKVALSRLLWHGRLEYCTDARYFRRYFPVRNESSRERMSGDAEELALAPFKDPYFEDFERLAKPHLSQLAYDRHLKTMTKLLLADETLKFERMYRQAKERTASTQKKLAKAKDKAQADAEVHARVMAQAEAETQARVKAQANAKSYKKRLIKAEVKLRGVEEQLAETKRMLDMTLASRLLGAYRSFKAKRLESGKSEAAPHPRQRRT